jgi:hypothetical protein
MDCTRTVTSLVWCGTPCPPRRRCRRGPRLEAREGLFTQLVTADVELDASGGILDVPERRLPVPAQRRCARPRARPRLIAPARFAGKQRRRRMRDGEAIQVGLTPFARSASSFSIRSARSFSNP